MKSEKLQRFINNWKPRFEIDLTTYYKSILFFWFWIFWHFDEVERSLYIQFYPTAGKLMSSEWCGYCRKSDHSVVIDEGKK